jgi:RNA polymerase sigma factor (sigma-70 family)
VDPAQIVAGIQAGEPAALEALYAILLEQPMRYLKRLTGPDEARDLIHNLYMAISRAILEGRMNNPATFWAYVWGSVRNARFDIIRRNIRVRTFQPLSEEWPDQLPGAEESILARELRARLRVLIGSLNPRDREAVNRYYLLEQPHVTIAREMGLSPEQSRNVCSRAVGRLRAMAA